MYIIFDYISIIANDFLCLGIAQFKIFLTIISTFKDNENIVITSLNYLYCYLFDCIQINNY